MALRNGYRVPSQVVTRDDRDKYPVVDINDSLGGPHIYKTEAEMLSIPAQRRRVGMRCYIINTQKLYKLINEVRPDKTVISDWEEIVEINATDYKNLINTASLTNILKSYALTKDLPDMTQYYTSSTIDSTFVKKADLIKNYKTAADCDKDYASAKDFKNLLTQMQHTIVAVKRPDLIKVSFGTLFANITVPTDIEATYADGTVSNIPVTWNSATYNPKIEGMQIVNGDLTLPAGTLNAAVNVTLHIEVGAETHIIDRFLTAMPITLKAPYGTKVEDIGLPDTVTVLYTDGTTGDLKVKWDKTQYSETDLNIQYINGTLELPNNVIQAPTPIAPQAVVMARVKPQNITSVTPVPDEMTFVGTHFTNLNLPTSVNVQLADGTFTDVDVEWDPSGYNPNNTGDQYIFGDFKFPEGVKNDLGVVPSIKVVVQSYPNICAVDDMPVIDIGVGSPISSLPLPTTCTIKTVAYDGTIGTDTANVRWDLSTLTDLNTPGVYTISGTIPVPPPDVTNKTNIIVYQDINVIAATTYVVSSIVNPTPIVVPYATPVNDIVFPTTVDLNIVGSDGTSRTDTVNVTWNTAPYDRTTPGTYNIVGSYTLPSGVTNPGAIYPVVPVTVSPAPVTKYPNVDSITVNPNSQTLDLGSDVSLVTPPSTINVMIEEIDGTISGPLVITVNWNLSAYRNNSLGKQIIDGTMVLPAGTTNTKNIIPQYTVELVSTSSTPTPIVKPVVVNMKNPDPINVPYGTTASDLVLPTDCLVTIQLVNGTFITQTYPVVWNTATFVQNQSGIQYLDGGVNIDDPDLDVPPNMAPQATIIVDAKPADPYISSYVAPAAVTVPYGSTIGDVVLPTTIEVTITKADGSTEVQHMPVTWNTSSFAGNVSGTYTFDGTLTVPSDIDGTRITDPTINVIVDVKPADPNTYTFEVSCVLPKGTLDIGPDMVPDLASVTEKDFYGYDPDTNDGLTTRTFEVLVAAVVNDNGDDTITLTNPVRVPLETSDQADIDRFVNDITAFDTANGTAVINDIPGGASSNMMYDEATHTISFNAVSATSNIRFILRKLTSGYLT